MFADLALEHRVQPVLIDLELGGHHRHHPCGPVDPGVPLVPGEPEHLRHGLGPIDEVNSQGERRASERDFRISDVRARSTADKPGTAEFLGFPAAATHHDVDCKGLLDHLVGAAE
jgi:hypothetical protein